LTKGGSHTISGLRRSNYSFLFCLDDDTNETDNVNEGDGPSEDNGSVFSDSSEDLNEEQCDNVDVLQVTFLPDDIEALKCWQQ